MKMHWKVVAGIAVKLALTATMLCQQATPKTPAAPPPQAPVPVQVTANVVCDANTVQASGFTDCEEQWLRSSQKDMQMLSAQMQEVQKAMQERIRSAIAARQPAVSYQPPSQQFPFGRLVGPTAAANPAPPPAAVQAPKPTAQPKK